MSGGPDGGASAAAVSQRARVRVCVVGPSLDILGGQSVQLARLLERLRGSDVVEVTFLPVNPRLPAGWRWLQRIKYVRTIVTSIVYVGTLVRRVPRHDVVHAFSASYWSFLLAPVPALLVARLAGRGALLNYHSGEAQDHLANWRSARLVRLAHRIVVPSEYLREVFAGAGLTALPIHNFVDPAVIPYRDRQVLRPVFLSNRNLEPMYNVACSIRAFARVQARVPEARLVIAGFGSQRALLEDLVSELALHNVRFAGRVPPDEMARYLDEADILLNSPDIDNMPLSLIEAQAAGLPVASTATGGIPYVVKHGETGLLVPPGDDEALAAAALRLLEEPGLASRLSTAARARCLAEYSWEAVAGQWVGVYREVAAASRARVLAGEHG